MPPLTKKRPYLFLPDGWDTVYKSAKAAIATTPLNALILGDSIPAGVTPATDITSTVWSSKLRTLWLTKYLGVPLHAIYWQCTGPSYNAPNCPFSQPLNGHELGGIKAGWMGSEVLRWPSATPIANYGQRFTSVYGCTALDYYWLEYYGGTFAINVDRDSPGTSFTYNLGAGNVAATTGTDIVITATNLSTTVKRIKFDGLPSGVHTVDYGKMSARYYVTGTLGIAEHLTGRAGGGLKWANVSFSGYKASWWGENDDATAFPNDQALLIGRGTVPNSPSGTGSGFGWPTAPHLLFIALGTNDNYDKTPDQFALGLEKMIRAARAGTPNCSIVLVVPAIPSPTPPSGYSDVLTGNTGWATWGNFVDKIYGLARAYNCAVVNMHAKWGETPGAQGYMVDNVHPTDAGHADYAVQIVSIL